jgi:hypothetical protein
MRLAHTPRGHRHDQSRNHGLPCVPDASAMDREPTAAVGWYHGSRDAIKRFLSTGEHGPHPGYSKLETTTSAQLDWRDVDPAIVSSPLVVPYLYHRARSPKQAPLHAGSPSASRHCIVLLHSYSSLSFFHCNTQRRTLCKPPSSFPPSSVAVQLHNLPIKLPQLVFGWPTDDFSDSLCIHSPNDIYPLQGLNPALSSWSLLAPVRCF